jgi:hypothetical protein
MLIPALIIYIGLAIASVFLVLLSWFTIVFSGKQPRGFFDFILKALRYWIATNAYGLLMTDTYPSSKP